MEPRAEPGPQKTAGVSDAPRRWTAMLRAVRNRFADKSAREDFLFVVICCALAIALRLSLFDHQSLDYHNFLRPWYDHLLQKGGFAGLKDAFSNYTPPYLYLLGLGTHLPLPKLHAIKAISCLFDFALAGAVLLLVRLKYPRRAVWLGAFAIALFSPTVVFNSALWGQCDVIYTAFLLGAVYFLVIARPAAALLMFGVAFSCKQQALFLLPLFAVLCAKGHLPLRYFLLVPAVYLALCLPAFAAGRPMHELLTIYAQQAGYYPRLTSSAPNLYQWLPDNSKLFGKPGLIFAVSVAGLLCYACLKSEVRWGKGLTVQLAFASSLLVPFSLPYMHERYFYPADCLAIVYAFYFPQRFYVAPIVVTVSLFSYFPFLFNGLTIVRLPYLALALAGVLALVVADLIAHLYPKRLRTDRETFRLI